MKIIIGVDHAGFKYKDSLIKLLKSMGHSVEDAGTNSSESVDYPDYAEKVSRTVACGGADSGILICGTGIGMSISANKVKGIRAALCWNVEGAVLAREHNSANVLCMGARLLSLENCIEITKTFLNTPLGNNERHLNRINKIKKIEERDQNCDE
jgi:ribose 5-phosphate isomerase B